MKERTLTETEIIAMIREMAAGPQPGMIVPIGDDAAVFHFTGGDVILTVDSLYEGVHFDLDSFDLSDVGWRAAASSVSDIAAMGGEPSCALASIAFAAAPTAGEVRALVGGLTGALSSCNCALAGGDVCRSGGGLALSVTVAGTPPPGGVVRRCGASPGDLIGVTGTAGDAAGGLHILRSGEEFLRVEFPALVEAHLRPVARVQAGVLLAAAGATSMADTSDGLAADLAHICDESAVGCELEREMIPVSDDLAELGRRVGVDPLDWALSGGEDFELLFTAPPGLFEEALGILAGCGIPAARIGAVLPEEAGRTLTGGRGVMELGGMGYEHFR